MGAIMNTDNTDKTRTRTVREWADSEGVSPDTARRTVSRKSGQTLGQTSPLTADEWAMWKPGKSGTRPPRKNKTSSIIVQPKPAAQRRAPPEVGEKEEAVFEWATVRSFFLDALLIGIVIGHAGLIWYDCAALWDVPGRIGGGLAFAIVCAAVMLATDPSKNITSTYALLLVFLVDTGAYWVHFPTFQNYSVPDAITSVLCVFLCAMSFGALFLYRHLKNN